MSAVHQRYSKEELARRGEAIYRSEISNELRPSDRDKLLPIDVESGDFELDDDELAAFDRLIERRPQAQVWLMRVGSPFVRRFGPRQVSS